MRLNLVVQRAEHPGGRLYGSEFEYDGRELNVMVESKLVLNDVGLIGDAAAAGHEIAFLIEDQFTKRLASGDLVRVLEDWCEPLEILAEGSPRQRSAY